MAVTLTGGEVSLREDWLELAAGVRQRRMTLTVLTNGTLLTRQDIERLAALRIARVTVSVYGADAATHDAVTGVDGSFQRTIEAVRLLRHRGVACKMSTVLVPENVGQCSHIIALADSLGCTYMFDPSVAPAEDGSDAVLRYRVPARDVLGFYRESAVRKREIELEEATRKPKRTRAANCLAGVTAAFIEASGDVLPCMGFTPSFGNVEKGSFAEIWRSEKAEEHRRAMAKPLPECDVCDLLQYCVHRCSRVAAVEDGDVSGPSKRACELAQAVKEARDEADAGLIRASLR